MGSGVCSHVNGPNGALVTSLPQNSLDMLRLREISLSPQKIDMEVGPVSSHHLIVLAIGNLTVDPNLGGKVCPTLAVEVVYRGIFQKTLARNIVRSIVFAARKDGKIGTAFGRYGDSPERNGIPAKQFAIVADDPEELEESLAVYQANSVDVTINVDDTMCKGIESWAWYGLQPINELTKPGGTLIVTSRQQADALLEDIHPKETPYNLSIVTGIPSFSGLWVYKDDHTDARILGALCKVCPDLVSLDAMLETIEEQMGGGTKIASAQRSFDRTSTRPVEPR